MLEQLSLSLIVFHQYYRLNVVYIHYYLITFVLNILLNHHSYLHLNNLMINYIIFLVQFVYD